MDAGVRRRPICPGGLSTQVETRTGASRRTTAQTGTGLAAEDRPDRAPRRPVRLANRATSRHRPALDAAAAPPGHRRGRAPVARRQRQYRRGARGPPAVDLADGPAGFISPVLDDLTNSGSRQYQVRARRCCRSSTGAGVTPNSPCRCAIELVAAISARHRARSGRSPMRWPVAAMPSRSSARPARSRQRRPRAERPKGYGQRHLDLSRSPRCRAQPARGSERCSSAPTQR